MRGSPWEGGEAFRSFQPSQPKAQHYNNQVPKEEMIGKVIDRR